MTHQTQAHERFTAEQLRAMAADFFDGTDCHRALVQAAEDAEVLALLEAWLSGDALGRLWTDGHAETVLEVIAEFRAEVAP